MVFVNEYVSEDDIKKYNLDRVWLDRNPVYKIEGKLPSGFRHEWTVDRESDTYFMMVGGGSYDRDFSSWVLYWGGATLGYRFSHARRGIKELQRTAVPHRLGS